MALNWQALEAHLKSCTVSNLAMEMARNLVRMRNKNPRFVGTASPTATDARTLANLNIITIDKENKVHFTKKALDLLNS
jgi:hypothetical protein